MKKSIHLFIASIVLLNVYTVILSGLCEGSEGNHDITILADESPPGWAEFDYAIDTIRVIQEGEGYTIEVDVENLGLCTANSAYGWASSTGRSCWGEWDFGYDFSHITDISFRVGDSSPEPGAKYRIELDGVHLGDAQVPANDSWYVVTVHNVSIDAGLHTLFLGTYQMDSRPDIYLDYIVVGEQRIEAERYDRTGGNDPDPDRQGFYVNPANLTIQFWDGEVQGNGALISEQKIGMNQTVADTGHDYPGNNFITYYVPSNTVYTVTTPWAASLGDHAIYVIIDPSNESAETNKMNNIASKYVTIPLGDTSSPDTIAFPGFEFLFAACAMALVLFFKKRTHS
ncbi:MAG: hypothetical protein JW771_04920 [Candidatus Thermoplasmatota archaeon]|nr:hypothetical protein [Candidatus Thermoplasmatota archaeon]